MPYEKTKTINCAIYTRKSTDEGLEVDFNTLDAQREACEAYIASQRGEGWRVLKQRYDDGGFSGGSMERPALKRLMQDIKAGHVDIVVVYKIDRLTRSLMDFAKLVDVFDAHNVTFVSVTQSFNTTTSMGRLTLNVLLSFAQFEREVSAERIRDKIAASKKKGMWMGGVPPLGYKVEKRQLLLDPPNMPLAQRIFKDYLKLGSVVDLKEGLDNEGITSPVRLTAKGNARGGRPFSRGALHHMLRNPIYNGKIRHKDETYDGQHTALIEDDLWQAVQDKLDTQAAFRQGEVKKVKSKALLKGLIYMPEGILYTPTRTKKGKTSYRYYTSQELLNKRDHPSAALGRLPAHEVEQHLLKGLRKELTKDEALYSWLGLDPMMDRDTAQHIRKHIEVLGEGLVKCLKRVEVHSKKLVATVSIASYAQLIGPRLDVNVEAMVEEAHVDISYYVRRAYKGTVVIKPTSKTTQTLDSLPQVQLQNLVRGIVWRDEHFAGMTIKALAEREGLSEAGIRKIIMQSFDQLASLHSQ